MKILHLNTERGWRGGERQTLWLAVELARRGHRSVLAAHSAGPLAARAREKGVEVLPVGGGEANVFSACLLRRWMKRENVPLLHAHTGHAVGMGALAVWGTPKALVATRRVDFPLGGGLLSRWKYRRVDALVAISSGVREMVERAGLAREKIHVIASGIDPAGYPSVKDRARLRAERGLGLEERVIVHVGALVPHKDQATLLAAFAEMTRSGCPARLLILGEGPLRKELQSRAQGPVTFLGHRPDVLEYTALADLFVFSSQQEGLGTALLDAMVLGVPTAATAAGGIPDLYGGPRASELSPVGEVGALAANMTRVLQNPEEAAARVARGRQRARRFTVSAMADAYEKIYEDLCRHFPRS